MSQPLYTEAMQDARLLEVHREWSFAAMCWKRAGRQLPRDSRERGYCLVQAQICERIAASTSEVPA
jgi:hypothetical protein